MIQDHQVSEKSLHCLDVTHKVDLPDQRYQEKEERTKKFSNTFQTTSLYFGQLTWFDRTQPA